MNRRRRRLPSGLAAPAAVLVFGGLVTLVAALDTKESPDAKPLAERAGAPPRPTPPPPTSTAPAIPADAVAVGAYIKGAPSRPQAVDKYARRTGRDPAIVHYFRSWTPGTFDRRSLRAATRGGAVPMITWEPWRRPLRSIARGRYDRYIRKEAVDARRWRRPILVRFAHEANGDWYPWASGADTRTYVRAWRHLVRAFRRAGARNVGWVWSPNVDYGGARLIRRLYPGDPWVDWVGLSGFSWGGPWPWESVVEIFGRSYEVVTGITKKPVMIAETGAGEIGGDKARWIRDAFAKDLRRLPRVRAIVWFNGRQRWARFGVDSTPEALAAFRSAIAAPRYSATPRRVVELTRGRRAR